MCNSTTDVYYPVEIIIITVVMSISFGIYRRQFVNVQFNYRGLQVVTAISITASK